MHFEWSLDYCLTCDREAPHGAAYCSQACRLADLERASCSSSPKTTASSSTTSAPGGFSLPPSLNFPTSSKSSTTSSTSVRSTTSTWLPPSQTNARKGSASSAGLHPSPSRTSLSSIQHFDQSYLSEDAVRELHDYANCFDQVRDYKRRMTVV